MSLPSGRLQHVLAATRVRLWERLTSLVSGTTVDGAFWEGLEEVLIGADVGVATAEKLVRRSRERAAREGARDTAALRGALEAEVAALVMEAGPRPALERVILMAGVNGAGKTTSIAKLARHFQGQGERVLLVAADTFRAAAIDQLKEWARRLEVEVVAHQPGADPGAVLFDGLEAARRRGVERVLVDTAGRLHTKENLMQELAKIQRVALRFADLGPPLGILVLDATVGQNGLAQARYFAETIPIGGILLAKLDGTARGGIVLAIADQLHLPVCYAGIGEGLDDLVAFDPADFARALCATPDGAGF